MANYSKLEKRRQKTIEAMEAGRPPVPDGPRCRCGQPARYEICSKTGVAYACEAHLHEHPI